MRLSTRSTLITRFITFELSALRFTAGTQQEIVSRVIQSSNPSFNGATVRINVFHSHRQVR